MPILIISVALAAVFALIALVLWTGIRVTGRKGHARRTFKTAGAAYLASLPFLLLLGFPLLISYLIAHASTRPQDQSLVNSPADFGREFTAVGFRAEDGPWIKGWYLEGSPALPPVILAHGLFRNRQEMLERACQINRTGHSTLLIDLRGHGDSQGSPISLGYLERHDVLGAGRFLRERLGARKSIYFGVSMGAVASLLAAADHPERVAGLILDSPFASLRETVERHTHLLLGLPAFPFADVFVWNLCRIGGFDPGRADGLHAATKLDGIPVLLVYGKDDRRMPAEVAERVFAALPGSAKRLVFVEGADHGAAFKAEPQRYIQEVTAFLGRVPSGG